MDRYLGRPVSSSWCVMGNANSSVRRVRRRSCAQGRGWGCGYSNGEGLSRFLAEEETPWGTLNAFATAAAWVGAGYPDWVTHTELTDRDSVSTGCAILYIYWLRSIGYSIPQIVQAGRGRMGERVRAIALMRERVAALRAWAQGRCVMAD